MYSIIHWSIETIFLQGSYVFKHTCINRNDRSLGVLRSLGARNTTYISKTKFQYQTPKIIFGYALQLLFVALCVAFQSVGLGSGSCLGHLPFSPSNLFIFDTIQQSLQNDGNLDAIMYKRQFSEMKQYHLLVYMFQYKETDFLKLL